MSIRNLLDGILSEAAPTASDSSGEKASKKIESDVTKQGAAGVKSGLGHGRRGDQSGTQDAHQGTKISDPSGAIQKGRGTEVQGNTDGIEESTESAAVETVSRTVAEGIAGLVEFSVDMSSIKSLCEAQDLDEEFAAKASEIFEAAVNDIIASKLDEICESADRLISEAVAEEVAKLEEQVDSYLDYVVTEWAEENRIAIEQGARTEIAESFMENMKELLESHYVELPYNKVDLYEAAIEQGEEIYVQLQEAEERNAQMHRVISEMEKAVVIESVVSNLTDVQADRVRTLAESMNYNGDVDAFSSKLETLAEGYVKPSSKVGSIMEDVGQVINEEEVATPVVDRDVAAAMSALSRLSH